MQPRPRSFVSAKHVAAFAIALVALAGGCAPGIGDECGTALDCSSAGTRLCDRTQPDGYCTLEGCEQGTCPEESVCVQFSPSEDRLATTFCMLRCDSSSDCRDDQGYECLRAMNVEADAEPLSDPQAFGNGIEAKILGNARQKFCAVRSELPESPPDASVDDEDGGSPLMSGG